MKLQISLVFFISVLSTVIYGQDSVRVDFQFINCHSDTLLENVSVQEIFILDTGGIVVTSFMTNENGKGNVALLPSKGYKAKFTNADSDTILQEIYCRSFKNGPIRYLCYDDIYFDSELMLPKMKKGDKISFTYCYRGCFYGSCDSLIVRSLKKGRININYYSRGTITTKDLSYEEIKILIKFERTLRELKMIPGFCTATSRFKLYSKKNSIEWIDDSCSYNNIFRDLISNIISEEEYGNVKSETSLKKF